MKDFSAAMVAGNLAFLGKPSWRWCQQGKIPPGQQFRHGKILFAAICLQQDEVMDIPQFANSLRTSCSSRSSATKAL
jgi:hypothetical protein